jgi:hypothetical protein
MTRGKEVGGEEPPEEDVARKPFLLRLPPDLMVELRGWASQELRSLNGHIEYLLRQAVRTRRDGSRRRDS